MLTVFSKNNCAACDSAKALLSSRGVEFVVKNCDEDYEAFDFIVSQGHRSFPQIYQGTSLFVQGGFKGLQEKLKDA